MEIAKIAYKALTAAEAKADALIKFNLDYAKWVAGAPAGQEVQYAFVHAATSGYVRNKVTDTGAGGQQRLRRHGAVRLLALRRYPLEGAGGAERADHDPGDGADARRAGRRG